MKIISLPKISSAKLELEYVELCAILKMIGKTSTTSRIRDFQLSKEEAISLSDIYEVFASIIPEEDR